MFEKLRAAVSSLTSAATERSLSEGDVDRFLMEFELNLMESDVAHEVATAFADEVRKEFRGERVKRGTDVSDLLRARLLTLFKGVFAAAPQPNVPELIRTKKAGGEPFVMVFLGINGTGKTTSIAKFAHLLKREGFSVVMACADTHRAGAIEQLAEHAERLSIKFVTQKYGADPAAVARDAVLHAESHRVDVVLVDTAGRMQTSRNLMDEMAKIIRVVQPDFIVFVGDALAGNDVVSQAREFLKSTGFHAAILTKADADVKGGAALSIAYLTKKPIIYLGVGQDYGSFVPFDTDSFVASLLAADKNARRPR